MADVSVLLDRFVQLFNTDRFDEALQDYAPEGVVEEVGTGRRLTPQEGIGNARAWRQAFPDAQGTITSKLIDGRNGAAEIVWRGTNRGPLMGQPPTGKAVTVRAVVVLETNGSVITRSSHYIDVAGLMGQLGAASGMRAAG
jgi:steroid delta-isomerase-like uncharacterized protein